MPPNYCQLRREGRAPTSGIVCSRRTERNLFRDEMYLPAKQTRNNDMNTYNRNVGLPGGIICSS